MFYILVQYRDGERYWTYAAYEYDAKEIADNYRKNKEVKSVKVVEVKTD